MNSNLIMVTTLTAAADARFVVDGYPAAMDIAHGHYPHADADASFNYQQIVSMPALTAAFGKAFAGKTPDLDRRVIFIRGVVTDAPLPSTVASPGPI